MRPSERVQRHLSAGRLPRAEQIMLLERMARQLGVNEQQVIREFGIPPLKPNPQVVYLLGHSRRPKDGEPVKIGTAKDVAKRIENIQAGSFQKLYLVCWFEGDGQLERELHDELAEHRIRGDWFEMCLAVREAFRARIEQQLAEEYAA